MDAKNKFREGFIVINRPFKFVEMKTPIQKNTIVWAYSEQPIIKKELSEEAKEKYALVANSSQGIGYFTAKDKEEALQADLEAILKDIKNYIPLYEGEIVQTTIEGVTCRFYPDEYSILPLERLQQILEYEGMHTICSPTLKTLKDFTDKVFYLTSRGIDLRTAERWCSALYKDLVYYKPYYELLLQTCRPEQIYPDIFYTEVEGIKF